MKTKIILLIIIVAITVSTIIATNPDIPIIKYSNSTPGNIQCVTGGCSSQVCGKQGEVDERVTTCAWKPEYGCNRDCKLRNSTCDFDPEFRETCRECVENCTIQIAINHTQAGGCYETCYQS